MSFTADKPCVTAKKFLAETLKNKKDPQVDENAGVIVQCSKCKTVKKAGLTLFKFFPQNGKIRWKNDILSCMHINWDGDPGCNCCHTIRNGKILCGDCTGWNVLEGTVTREMRGHRFTWTDGTCSIWRKKTKAKSKAKPKTKKRSYAELEAENKVLKSKLAKIIKLVEQ